MLDENFKVKPNILQYNIGQQALPSIVFKRGQTFCIQRCCWTNMLASVERRAFSSLGFIYAMNGVVIPPQQLMKYSLYTVGWLHLSNHFVQCAMYKVMYLIMPLKLQMVLRYSSKLCNLRQLKILYHSVEPFVCRATLTFRSNWRRNLYKITRIRTLSWFLRPSHCGSIKNHFG